VEASACADIAIAGTARLAAAADNAIELCVGEQARGPILRRNRIALGDRTLSASEGL
jgi:hypothetical protein